jgi:hypothetical protein
MPDGRGHPITLSAASNGQLRVIDGIDERATVAKSPDVASRYPKFRNDRGAPEIRIASVRECPRWTSRSTPAIADSAVSVVGAAGIEPATPPV